MIECAVFTNLKYTVVVGCGVARQTNGVRTINDMINYWKYTTHT